MKKVNLDRPLIWHSRDGSESTIDGLNRALSVECPYFISVQLNNRVNVTFSKYGSMFGRMGVCAFMQTAARFCWGGTVCSTPAEWFKWFQITGAQRGIDQRLVVLGKRCKSIRLSQHASPPPVKPLLVKMSSSHQRVPWSAQLWVPRGFEHSSQHFVTGGLLWDVDFCFAVPWVICKWSLTDGACNRGSLMLSVDPTGGKGIFFFFMRNTRHQQI